MIPGKAFGIGIFINTKLEGCFLFNPLLFLFVFVPSPSASRRCDSLSWDLAWLSHCSIFNAYMNPSHIVVTQKIFIKSEIVSSCLEPMVLSSPGTAFLALLWNLDSKWCVLKTWRVYPYSLSSTHSCSLLKTKHNASFRLLSLCMKLFFHLVMFKIMSSLFSFILQILEYFPTYLTYNGCFQYIICVIIISANVLEISFSFLSHLHFFFSL